MVTMTNPLRIKLLLVGESSVGKSCLLLRFVQRDGEEHIVPNPSASIGNDVQCRNLTVDNRQIKLELWDTAGSERFREAITPMTYRGTHGLLLVYDIANRKSFDELPQWIADSQRFLPADTVVVIIGNKIDQESSRQVSTQEAQELARQYQASYFETSATTAVGVKSALEDLVRQIFEKPLLMIQVNAASVPVGGAVTIQSSSGNGDPNPAARRSKYCAC